MFSSSDSGNKPSLLTLANRQSPVGDLGSASARHVDQRAGGKNPAGVQGAGDSALTKLLDRIKQPSSSSQPENPEAAMSSIERDVHAYVNQDIYRPLIDPRITLGTIWRHRWLIAGTTILGGVLGVLVALNTPQKYTAYSQVLIDPRQVELVDRDLTPEFLGNDSALAIVDSQLQAIYSTPVLQRVVDKLGLDRDAEFNGASDSGIGLIDGIAFVRSLFSSETPVETNGRRTIANLRDAVDAERTSRTFIFSISAESENQRRSAQIANALTEAFIENQREREALAARNATSALDAQLVELQAAVESAERKAEAFAQANNISRVEGLTLTDNQLVATSAQLNEAQAATIRAKSLADAAQAASVESVVSGGLPPDLVTSALTTFRAQFASLSQNAASLERALGPRHPRLENAIAAREAARDEIAAELQRIKAGTQADLRRAVQTEQEIAAALAQTRAAQSQDGEALITLRELEAEIEAAQAVYKAALLRSRETNQLENLVSVNATVISEAEPPLTASSLPRRFIALTGLLSGMAVGFGIALLAGLRDSMMAGRAPSSPSTTPRGGPTGSRIRQMAASAKPSSNYAPVHASEAVSATSEKSMYYPRMPQYPYATDQQYPSQAHPRPGYHHPEHGQPAPQRGMEHMQPAYDPMQASAPMDYPPQAAPNPYYGQPHPQGMGMPMAMDQHSYSQPMPDPRYQQAALQISLEEERELEELRASVREIRDVVDHLVQTRSARRRFG